MSHIRGFFRGIGMVLYQVVFPPSHQEFQVLGSGVEDCLRRLEREASLPQGDLSVTGNPREVKTWPIIRSAIEHQVCSKSGDALRDSPKTEGYISGHVTEICNPGIAAEHLDSGSLQVGTLAHEALVHADSVMFSGTLNVVRNCPGVFHQGVCKNCGYETS